MIDFDRYDIARTERTGYPFKQPGKIYTCDICGQDILSLYNSVNINGLLICDGGECRQAAAFSSLDKEILLDFVKAYNLEYELTEFYLEIRAEKSFDDSYQ